jgi:hypothetical protein
LSEMGQEQAQANPQAELSAVLITLLKGVLYREGNQALWNTLLRLRAQAISYMHALGLVLHVDEGEGHAYLRSRPVTEEEENAIPRLIARRPLSFYDSLLLALLRKKLTEFDVSGTESKLILKLDQILELMALFLPEHTDEVKLQGRVEQSVQRLQEMGFLRKLKSTQGTETFEVLRIIKAFVDAQWLDGLEKGLAGYRDHSVEAQIT